VREVDPYGPSSEFSYFRDLTTVSAAAKHADASALKGRGVFAAPGTGIPHPVHGTAEDAQKRLFASFEHRVVVGAGGGFYPTDSTPNFVAEAFATAVRAHAALAPILPQLPLPAYGPTVDTVRLDTGTSSAIQAAENTTVGETDSPPRSSARRSGQSAARST
jgi:hypothetical protein